MGVQDNFPVSASYTNARFLSKNTPDTMPFPLAFTGSGANIADIQAAVNKLYTASGASETTTGTVYNATAGTVTNGDPYQTCITILADKFDATTGHKHTGAAGDAPILDVVLTAAVSGTGGTPITGNITFTPGDHMMISQSGTDFSFSSLPSTSIAASGNSGLVGDVVLAAGTDITLSQSGQVITINSFGGGGGTGINYITNPNAEVNTSGWATYANTPGPIPVDGTGGSPSITLTRSTVDPLRGTASFLLSKDAADRQGEGVSSDFTIDPADEANVLTVSFNYQVDAPFVASSGLTGGSSDIEVFIYDITNTILIPVTPNVITTLGPNNFFFLGSFQTAPNSTSYRLIFHITSVNASAYDFKFDNVAVGPSASQVLDPLVTASAGLSTLTSILDSTYTLVPYDTLNFDTNAAFNTTTSAGLYVVPVSGYYNVEVIQDFSPDATGQRLVTLYKNGVLFSIITAEGNPSGTNGTYVSGTLLMKVNAGDQLQIYAYQTSGSTLNIGTAGPTFSRVSYNLIASFPDGLSLNTIAMTIQSASPTATITNPFSLLQFTNSPSEDTNGAFDPSTGLYTIPAAGFYSIHMGVGISGTYSLNDGSAISIYQNGAATYSGFNIAGGVLTQDFPKVSGILYCNAGDTIAPYISCSATSPTVNPNVNANYFTIARIAGPVIVNETETVAARWSFSPSSSLTSGSLQTIIYGQKNYDTHGAYTGTYTAPISGVYKFSACLEFAASTGQLQLIILVNNTDIYGLVLSPASSGTSSIINGSTDIFMNAGDGAVFQAFQNSGGSITIAGSGPQYSSFSVARIK